MIRDSLSTQEMEDMVRTRETMREGCRLNTLSNDELNVLIRGMNAPFSSLTTILTSRRTKLRKLLNAIDREREQVKKSIDFNNLTADENFANVQRLEKMINDYCILNEGLRRNRGGRRLSRASGGTSERER